MQVYAAWSFTNYHLQWDIINPSQFSFIPHTLKQKWQSAANVFMQKPIALWWEKVRRIGILFLWLWLMSHTALYYLKRAYSKAFCKNNMSQAINAKKLQIIAGSNVQSLFLNLIPMTAYSAVFPAAT